MRVSMIPPLPKKDHTYLQKQSGGNKDDASERLELAACAALQPTTEHVQYSGPNSHLPASRRTKGTTVSIKPLIFCKSDS